MPDFNCIKTDIGFDVIPLEQQAAELTAFQKVRQKIEAQADAILERCYERQQVDLEDELFFDDDTY